MYADGNDQVEGIPVNVRMRSFRVDRGKDAPARSRANVAVMSPHRVRKKIDQGNGMG